MTLTWNLFEGEKNWLTQIVQCTVENDSLLPSFPPSPFFVSPLPLSSLPPFHLFSLPAPPFSGSCVSLRYSEVSRWWNNAGWWAVWIRRDHSDMYRRCVGNSVRWSVGPNRRWGRLQRSWIYQWSVWYLNEVYQSCLDCRVSWVRILPRAAVLFSSELC